MLEALNPEQIDGSISPYISPEQTGRMNLPLDYRSDIYSMGVSLYQLFTKQLFLNLIPRKRLFMLI